MYIARCLELSWSLTYPSLPYTGFNGHLSFAVNHGHNIHFGRNTGSISNLLILGMPLGMLASCQLILKKEQH